MFGKPTAKSEGNKALAALDRALSSKPQKNGTAFAESTEHLCTMRDIMIAEHRAHPADPNRLERLNAILSTSLAGHFPIGNVPWDEVEHERGKLRKQISEPKTTPRGLSPSPSGRGAGVRA